ncbi:thiamine diphosphokinase [Paracoccus amoyensis]|uniref:thiamine diphosphokinase n=1 Tax=Paracoccus amoyensis TaxID=2760093 RepID=UPI0031B5C5E3
MSADHGVTVVGGGLLARSDLRDALNVAPVLVAADGGADHLLEFGLMPDWVIGDLDSLSDSARHVIPAMQIVVVAEQDSTDFEKCLSRISAPFVIAVGFAGLRLDHTLAALSVMVRSGWPPVIMLSSDDLVFLAPSRIDLPLLPGTRVSLYPMGPARGQSRGLVWPIDGLQFAPDGRVGTSNRAEGAVCLEIDGPMLVMLPRDTLGIVLTALGLRAA